MKSWISVVLLLLFYTSCLGQDYSAVTYNLRLNIESDGINQWENRKEWLVNQVKDLSPDVLGTQEGLHDQITYMDSTLSNYQYVGIGREDGATKGEYAAIFYKGDLFKSSESGTFWLSETPDTVSKGWGANYERICTYSLFFDEERDQHFWVFNAHFDHESKQARIESVKLICQKIQTLNDENYPVIFMGDLNAIPDSPPISFLNKHMRDSRNISQNPPLGPVGTFNGFDVSHPLDHRIDYIFVDENITIQQYNVINEIKDNRTPSDHLPVFVNFSITPSNQ